MCHNIEPVLQGAGIATTESMCRNYRSPRALEPVLCNEDLAQHEVQRTMLELINQLDGFDPRGNIKVLMATNRPDTLDPALMRPGRLDRKIEFSLPDLEVGTSFHCRKGILDIFSFLCYFPF